MYLRDFIVTALMFLFADAAKGVPTVEACPNAVDIAFIVDSSHSIYFEYEDELLFVQRIAERFDISKTGTHAGLIIFSDAKDYTKVTIKFDDFMNTKEFNRAVAKSEFIGYRTRIDYAFQKAKQELFTAKGGARRYMKKIILLITDGRQNPTMNVTTMVPFDPVAASQSLYDNGVNIFVVGIGDSINPKSLADIARDKTKVYYANSINTLISDDFVRKVSKKLCDGVLLRK